MIVSHNTIFRTEIELENNIINLKRENMNTGKVLLGVLAGVAAGAMLGILFAPARGSDTRKNIAKKGEDYADAVKSKFDGLIETVKSQFEGVKEEITSTTDQLKAKAKNVNI